MVDHVGLYFLSDNAACRLIGRAAAPLFFFLVGYSGKVHLSVFLILYGIILSFTGGVIAQHFWINILLNFVLIHFLLRYIPLERLSLLNRLIGFTLLMTLTPFVYPYLEYGFLGILVAYSARSLALSERFASHWMAVTLILYGVYQAIIFNFLGSTTEIIALGGLFLGLYVLFQSYELIPLDCPPKLQIPALIISRYSLHIYFYHLIIFQGITFYLKPHLLYPYFH